MLMRKYGQMAMLVAGILNLSACLGDTDTSGLPQDDGTVPSPTEASPSELDPTVRVHILRNTPDAPRQGDAQPGGVTAFNSLPLLCGVAYTDGDMQGYQYELYANQESFVNYNVSSLAVGPSCTVTLYDRYGASQNFTSWDGTLFYAYVGNAWNDRATRIYCSCTAQRLVAAQLYENEYHGGNYIPIWNEVHGGMPPGWNDRVTSLKTNVGSALVMTDHNPADGSAHVTQGTSTNNVGGSFNDRASFFKSAGTYWPGCAPTSGCFRNDRNCGGLSVWSPGLHDCFVNKGGLSYCQPSTNGSSVCIPTFF